MRVIDIPTTGIRTSALGFGCAGLTSLNDRRRALELLNVALDAGITHFDVARLYGFGHAEGIVGEFMAGRRDRVTITTKFGLQPPTGMMTGSAGFISLARSVVKRFPLVAGPIRRRAAKMVATSAFTPAAAAQSLEKSLAELRTDHVDFLLLHEATLADARSDELLRFLSDQLARGTARSVGVASAADALGADLEHFPPLYRLFQFENSIVDRRLEKVRGVGNVGVITHGVLKPLGTVHRLAMERPAATKRWSDQLSVDLSSVPVLARRMLSWAASTNTRGPVLFSTTRVENLRANATGFDDSLDGERDMLFVQFVDELTAGAPPAR